MREHAFGVEADLAECDSPARVDVHRVGIGGSSGHGHDLVTAYFHAMPREQLGQAAAVQARRHLFGFPARRPGLLEEAFEASGCVQGYETTCSHPGVAVAVHRAARAKTVVPGPTVCRVPSSTNSYVPSRM